jgi:glycosyltransferase involved in cell wall biosynthesis
MAHRPITIPDGGTRVRVLHVIESLETGGMERMVSALAQNLDPTRFEVRVLCLKRLGPIADELAAKGLAVERFRGTRGLMRYLAFLPLAQQMREWRPHVAHTHNSPALFFGAPAARLAGVRRIIHTEHGRAFPDARKYMLAERALSPLLHRYVCVSEQTRQDVAQYEGIAQSRLQVVPNGVMAPAVAPAAALQALRASCGIPAMAPVVGTVGRLVWEKHYTCLLQAFARVKRQVPESHLVLVGDGPERAKLEALAGELTLGDAVHFTGLRTDVALWHQVFDVFAMSSVSEGLPLALLEAMASSRAIVATRVGGIPLALADGAAGELVDRDDPDALADALITLLESPSQAAEFGARAQRRFREAYDVNAMVAQYSALYLDR